MQAEADDFGNQHRAGLAEHSGFCFDTADAPTENAERVDHRGVRVGADDGVGIGFVFIAALHAADDAGEIFEVDLVTDAGVWRDDFEILERGLAPAEKRVTLDVALEFEFGVEAKRLRATEIIDLDGVVDDEFGGEERVDALGVATHFFHRFAHGGEIDDRGNAGEILQQDARGHEGDFFLRAVGRPRTESLDVFGMDEAIVFKTEEVLEKHTQRKGKGRELGDSLLFEIFKAMNFEGLSADVEGVARFEGVASGDGHSAVLSEVRTSMITEKVERGVDRADAFARGAMSSFTNRM